MAYQWTSKTSGKTGMTLELSDLDAQGKALYAKCRETYRANRAAHLALELHISEKLGQPLAISWTFGSVKDQPGMNLKPGKTPATRAPVTLDKQSLAAYLDSISTSAAA